NPEKRIPLNRVLDHPFFDQKLPIIRLRDILSNDESSRDPLDSYKNAKSKRGFSKNTQFNTDRLKPLKQKTKHAFVEILPTGTVFLDFYDDRYLITITKDGGKIDIFERPVGKETPAILVNPIKSYTFDELPIKYLKKYRYAAKFIELVKSKTPKIIFYSPQAKCILMENGPMADFEMWFSNRTMVRHSVAKESLEITIPSSTQKDNFVKHKFTINNNLDLKLPLELLSIFKHMQDCLKQCLDIERNGSLNSSTVYPLILRSSRSQVKNKELDTKLNNHQENPLCQARSAPTPELTTPAVITQPPVHVNGSKSDEAATQCTTNRKRPSSSTYSMSFKSTNSCLGGINPVENMTCKYIEGLGWCVKTLDSRFTMLFEDGVKVVLESKNQCLKYSDESKHHNINKGKVISFPIDHNLPSYAKERLAHFREFAKLFKDP
ncbi:10923_t:CDS:2, partial [Ambispora leptoticha]